MIETAFTTLAHFFAAYGYWVIFFGVMLENAGIPLPGETVLLFAGFLAYQGRIELVPAILVAIGGAACGDTIGYWVGCYGGRPLINRLFRKFAPAAKAFDHSEILFLKFGHWAVFTGRFITGLRVFAGILAGLYRMPYPRFLLFNVSGAVAWAVAITSLGYIFGNHLKSIFEFLKRFDQFTLLAVGVALLVLAAFWIVRRWRSPLKNETRTR